MFLCGLSIPIVLLLCCLTDIASGTCVGIGISCASGYYYTCTVDTDNATRASDLMNQCMLSSAQLGISKFMFNVYLQEENGTLTLVIASGVNYLFLIVYDTASVEFTQTHPGVFQLFLWGTSTSTLYCPYDILDYFPNVYSFGLSYVAIDRLYFPATELTNIYYYYLTLPQEVTILTSLWALTIEVRLIILSKIEDSNWYNLSPDSFDNVQLNYIELNGIQHLYTNQFANVTGLTALRLGPFFSDFTFDENALSGLNELERLTIYQLPNFDLLAEQTFPSLNEFYLQSYNLMTLPQEFFERQKALTKLTVPDTSLHCDCEMAWLSYVSNELGWTVIGTCNTPASLIGKSIADSSNYISCPNNQSYHCFNDTFICPTEISCVNTADSAYCDCGEGYAVDETNNSCVDVNECASVNNCEQNCTNTVGSYNCSCSTGYTLQPPYTCEDMNECSSANNCEQNCHNTAGSYTCSCLPGFSLQLDSFSCVSGVGQLTAQTLIALISLLLQIYLL